MTEDWCDVVGYEGIYSVSSLGRVHRDVPAGGPQGVSWPAGYILKPVVKTNGGVGRKRYAGYLGVRLSNSKGTTNHRLAGLVAAAFIGPRPEGSQVNHIDGNKANNAAVNLEYTTPKENRQHASRIGLNAMGTRHGSAKLTEAQVREIRAIPFNDRTGALMELERRFGISRGASHSIRSRHTWRHLA